MGSVMSAIADDQDELDAVLKKVQWKGKQIPLYSREQNFLEEAANLDYTGDIAVAYLAMRIKNDNLEIQIKQNKDDFFYFLGAYNKIMQETQQ